MQCLKKLKNISLFNILILLLISLIYSFLYNVNYKSKFSNDNVIYGYINGYNINGNKLSIELNSKEKILCNYYFKTKEELENFNLKLGDYIKLYGNIDELNDNTNFNAFNYKQYLKYEHINYIFNISNIEKIKNNNRLKYKIKNLIIDKINNSDNKEYLYTFILGNSKYIDNKILESYRINGISHLFCISGMHVSLLSFLLLKIFNKYKFKNIIVIFFLLFYMFLTNFSPSVLRAGIFFILLLLNKKLNLNIKTSYLMLILLSICIFIDPFIIYKIGFQYSYIISFALLLFNDIIKRHNNMLIKILIVSFISFVSSIPITINNFYQINILSIILNIFYVPLISSVIFPLILISFIIPLPFLKYIIIILEVTSIYLSKIKSFILILSKMNILMVIIYYLIIFFVLHSIKIKNYKPIFILIIVIFTHIMKPYIYNNYKVIFFDVGQGDSAYIKLPNNKGNIIIDTGGIVSYNNEEWKKRNNDYSISKDIIINYLKSIGTNNIDYLILTHGDFDHMGEAINLVNNFKVEKVIFNCGPYNDLEKELIKVLDKKNIPYYSCIKELNIDNNKLYFLQTKEYDNENDNSNVIYTELDGYKFMFMGDAGVAKEQDILNKYNISNIDVLKVGHHGSKTSSCESFINEMNPKYSIISVGKTNRYGHPNKEVLNNLENSKIYRTDEDGSIMFKIKNNKLQVETCAP